MYQECNYEHHEQLYWFYKTVAFCQIIHCWRGYKVRGCFVVLPPIIPLLQCFLPLSSFASHLWALLFLSVSWNILLRPLYTYQSCQILLGCPHCHIMILVWLRHMRVRALGGYHTKRCRGRWDMQDTRFSSKHTVFYSFQQQKLRRNK